MKHLGKTEDQAFGNLLRAYVSRPSNAHQVCEFDPDLATAYIERSLTPASRSQYEGHLSECAACRKHVVALVRLAGVDAIPSASPARREAPPSWVAGVKRAFGALSAPQWAMAAAAVIVLAVSVPLLLSNSQSPLSKAVAPRVDDSAASDKPQGASPSTESGLVAAAKSGDSAPSGSAAPAPKEQERRETGALAKNTAPAAPAEDRPAAEQPQSAETKPAPKPVDETQRKAEGQVVAQAPGSQAAPETQARDDSQRTRQLQESKKDAVQGEAKAERIDEGQAQKEKTRVAELAAAPPATSSKSEAVKGGKGLTQPAKLALRDSESVRARVIDRKVGNKKFWLRDNTWTDRDFDPGKDLPIVTIIRDSNVYNELLSKRAGLKPYLTGFLENERAVIVYKGTVYKLIPQQNDK